MLALGIDPGTLHLGWGVVRRQGTRLVHVAHGVIHLDGQAALSRRLTRIESELAQVLARYRPEVSSVESLFFHKDAQAAAKLGHARGVVLLTLARADVPIAEYAPAQVKRVVTGSGRAEKSQVALMVRALMGLSSLPSTDATDALALAVTHLRSAPFQELLRQNGVLPLLKTGAKRRRNALLEAALRGRQKAPPARKVP